MADDEQVFQREVELKAWLECPVGVCDGVGGVTTDTVARVLLAAGYDRPSTLYGITPDEVRQAGVASIPMRRYVSNKIQEYRHQQQQQQQQQQRESWYQVTGAISRPGSHAGARYNVFRFAASGGLYPEGLNANSAIEVTLPSTRKEASKTILKFSVVFPSLDAAGKFLDNLAHYLGQSRSMLHFCDDEGEKAGLPPMTPIAPFSIQPHHKILLAHYVPCDGEHDDAVPRSPVLDVAFETRSMSDDSSTVDVTILSKRDDIYVYQSIENPSAFSMTDPESAHIFPKKNCVGQYKWLDDKPFNRLALSGDLHVNFDGTGRGRGVRRQRVQTIAMRPMRNPKGYSITRIGNVDCFEIPLEIVINDNTKAEPLLKRLRNHAQLHMNESDRWTITGAELRLFYPRNRRVDLVSEVVADGPTATSVQPPLLVSAVPGVSDLSRDCWSNSPQNLFSLEAAEIMEKCLFWNYHNALETWAMAG
jgi:hypothetical protein